MNSARRGIEQRQQFQPVLRLSLKPPLFNVRRISDGKTRTNQTDFNLESALQLVETYTGFGKLFTKNDSLPEIINELLKF